MSSANWLNYCQRPFQKASVAGLRLARNPRSGGSVGVAPRRRIAHRALACGLALLLSGCVAGPDYVRLTMEVPDQFAYTRGDAEAIARLDWWRQFNDSALDRLIAEALAENLSLRIAAARIDQAAAVFVTTRAPLFPRLDYQFNGDRQRLSQAIPSSAGMPAVQNTFSGQLVANWEIDLWGRIRRQIESAEANLIGAEEARRGAILSLLSAVATGYIQLRSLDEQLAITRNTAASYREILHTIEGQAHSGQTVQLNAEQARGQYENVAAGIPQFEQQVVQTENALRVLLGRMQGPVLRGRGLGLMIPPQPPRGLPSQVLANRPDIAQSEQDLIAANAQIGAAEALYFPRISLIGSGGGVSAELANLFSGPAGVWSFAGAVTGPIFNAGAISGQVDQARALREQMLNQYRLNIQNAFREVQDALVAFHKSRAQRAHFVRSVAALRAAEVLALAQYRDGQSDYTTVLVAQSNLYQARLMAVQAQQAVLSNAVAIYKSMGGGWERPRPAVTLLPSDT